MSGDLQVTQDDGERVWVYGLGSVGASQLQEAIEELLAALVAAKGEQSDDDQSSPDKVDLTSVEPLDIDGRPQFTVTLSGNGNSPEAVDIIIRVGTGIAVGLAMKLWDRFLFPELRKRYGDGFIGPRRPKGRHKHF